MKSFKRKLAAFMAVVLVLTSFNTAWAKNTSRSSADDELFFSIGSGGYQNEFHFTTDDGEQTITVTASASDAVRITKVEVASPSEAIEVATASDASMTVMPKAEGKATVKVTAEVEEDPVGSPSEVASGSEPNVAVYTGTFTVIVTKEEEVKPESSLLLDPEVVTITAGESTRVLVKATPSEAEVTDLSVDWNDTSVIKVTADQGDKAITITAASDAEDAKLDVPVSAKIDGQPYNAVIRVVVNGKAPAVKGELLLSADNATLKAGESTKIMVTATPSQATVTDLSVDWEDTSVIKVNADPAENVITITAASDAKDEKLEVPVSARVAGELKEAVIKVSVIGKKVEDKVTGIEVTIGEEDKEYYVGQPIVAYAKLLPEGIDAQVTWKASGIEVEEAVSEDGMSVGYYAKSAGDLVIEATADGVSGTATVTVKPINGKVTFTENSVVMNGEGDTYDFWKNSAVSLFRPQQSELREEIAASLKERVVLSSSDKEILDISEDGIGTAVKPGIVTVTARIDGIEGIAKFSAECKVQILSDETYQLVLDQAAMDFADVNLIQKLDAKLYAVEKGKDPVEVTDLEKKEITLKWVSSNADIVTVDEMGMATAVAEGKAVLTVSAADQTGKVLASQECQVTVNKVVPVADGAVVNNYKNDADISAVLNAEDLAAVTEEQLTAAADKIASVITAEDMDALLKNEAETAKVMDDLTTVENGLLLKGIVEKPNYTFAGSGITGIEADGLAMNAFAHGEKAAGMNVATATVEVPKAIAGNTIIASIAVDIQLTGIGELLTPVRIKLGLPAGYNSSNTGVIHYGSRGMEILPCTVSGGKVIFTVSDLSPFAIVKLQTKTGGSVSGGSSSGSSRVSSKKAPAIPETPGYWYESAAGWQFYNNAGALYVNTWIYVGGHWYWIDQNGIMAQGWQQINGQFYYLTPGNGAMVTGWIQATGQWYYTDANGARVTGWQFINNYWYYFGQDGIMLANTTTPDGYHVDANGAWDSVAK